MLFFVGVGMAVLGVALCIAVQHEMDLPFGRRLKVKAARIAGVFLIAFIPAVLLLYVLLIPFPEFPQLVYELIRSILVLICFVGAVIVLWRGSARTESPDAKSQPTRTDQRRTRPHD